jgi:hypothetical protein
MANQTHGSLAAEAAAYLRESAEAMEGGNGIEPEIRRQADCLLEWARKKNLILTDSFTDGLEKFKSDTLEHVVYLRPSDRRVIKCTKPGRFGLAHGADGCYGRHVPATPLFYLRRIELSNREFPTDLRLEGIALGKPDFGNKEELRPYIVTSQRLIEPIDVNCQNPSEEEIAASMMKLGFKLLPENVYNWVRESDGIVVTDARMLNFILSDEGIIPIDLIIAKYPTPAPANRSPAI